ncbi:hypothetical protein RHMOL_Rhmol09G0144900 [Rhododendron molle]|uniref:Uncharacterized protein n=1 Tax=Rhododendron molle TaxID=49168 RepID=A0ACC0MEH5_RHOML|nr:hypothetical protein RHMOL_Rhmol09G0144900 [Rhododendron molle]
MNTPSSLLPPSFTDLLRRQPSSAPRSNPTVPPLPLTDRMDAVYGGDINEQRIKAKMARLMRRKRLMTQRMSHRKIVFQLWENCQHESAMIDEATDVQQVSTSQSTQIVKIGIYCSKWMFPVRANTIDLRNLIEEYLGIRLWQNR